MTSVGEHVEELETCTLLVGMQIGTAFMKNSIEISQKIKNRNTIGSSNLKRFEIRDSDICTPMFTAALFIVSQAGNNPHFH